MNLLRLFAVSAFAAVGAGLPDGSVLAQQPERIGRFGDWTAYVSGSDENKFCYLVSSPQQAELRDRRGGIFYMIWHRPASREFDVVQVNIGYPFKEGSQVELSIRDQNWKLFTDGRHAWAFNSEEDAEIVDAMRRGLRMTVRGVSSRDNATRDVYSLSGVTAGHNAINRACGR